MQFVRLKKKKRHTHKEDDKSNNKRKKEINRIKQISNLSKLTNR